MAQLEAEGERLVGELDGTLAPLRAELDELTARLAKAETDEKRVLSNV